MPGTKSERLAGKFRSAFRDDKDSNAEKKIKEALAAAKKGLGSLFGSDDTSDAFTKSISSRGKKKASS